MEAICESINTSVEDFLYAFHLLVNDNPEFITSYDVDEITLFNLGEGNLHCRIIQSDKQVIDYEMYNNHNKQ